MFRISLVEVVIFAVLALAAYSALPTFFEGPMMIVTLVVIALVTHYLWFFVRLMFSKVILVRGTGVAVLTKDFQTQPINANPDVWKIVGNLRNMYVTAVIWSFSEDFDKSVYDGFKLNRFFDKCFYPSDFLTADPREFLKRICGALGVSPSRVVLIDNDDKGIAAAKSLGITSIKYTNALKLQEELRAKGL